MTDNEIIKALECCGTQGGYCGNGCFDCPLSNQYHASCMDELYDLALGLINKQNQEIERLSALVDKQN